MSCSSDPIKLVTNAVVPNVKPCRVSAGTLPEGNSGRDHGWRPWREPWSCDYRPRGQWDGHHSLESDAGHSEEARVHVAPPAQDLVLLFPSRVNETLCSSCSFRLPPRSAAVSLKDKFWLTPYLHTRGRNLKSQCQSGAGSDWIASQLSFLCLLQVTDCECGSYIGKKSKTDGIIFPSLLLCKFSSRVILSLFVAKLWCFVFSAAGGLFRATLDQLRFLSLVTQSNLECFKVTPFTI